MSMKLEALNFIHIRDPYFVTSPRKSQDRPCISVAHKLMEAFEILG